MVMENKNKIWLLDPNSICSTYPEDPVNNYLNSDNNWSLELKCSLNKLTGNDETIFCVLPNYIGLDVHKNTPYLSITYKDKGNVFYELPFNYIPGRVDTYKLEYSIQNGIVFYLNGTKVFNSPIVEQIESQPKQIVVIGSNTTDTTEKSARNSNVTLYTFKAYVEGVLVSDNDFSNIIANKTIDQTGKLNFLQN